MNFLQIAQDSAKVFNETVSFPIEASDFIAASALLISLLSYFGTRKEAKRANDIAEKSLKDQRLLRIEASAIKNAEELKQEQKKKVELSKAKLKLRSLDPWSHNDKTGDVPKIRKAIDFVTDQMEAFEAMDEVKEMEENYKIIIDLESPLGMTRDKEEIFDQAHDKIKKIIKTLIED
jgi:hypothetical protein